MAGPLVLARRRDSLARTSGAGGVAKEACGGSARRASLGPAAARKAIEGFITLIIG